MPKDFAKAGGGGVLSNMMNVGACPKVVRASQLVTLAPISERNASGKESILDLAEWRFERHSPFQCVLLISVFLVFYHLISVLFNIFFNSVSILDRTNHSKRCR